MGRAGRKQLARRLVALIRMAQTHRYAPSLKQLADEHGVCQRTIRRDLEVIEETMPVRWRQWEWNA
jgi:predicted DNA-binding transcriptional regulator YafY